MRKQIRVVVKEGKKETPYLFDTKKDAQIFIKRCKALKQEYVTTEA